MAKLHSETSKSKTSTIFRRGIQAIGRATLTVLFIAGAGVAVYLGMNELSNRAEASPTPEAAPLIPVSAPAVVLEDGYQVTRSFVGQVEPQKTVSISFELNGQLELIAFDEGDTVRAGDILAMQDTSLLKAEQKQLFASKTATDAQLTLALQTLERSEKLNERGHTSQSGLDEALARVDELRARITEIDAALIGVNIRIEKARLTAPFDGRVTERLVDGGETLNAGQPIMELVQVSKPQVRIGIPLSLDETDIEIGQIEIANEIYAASLIALRPDIDPVTRTRTAVFELETGQRPAFGQTAKLVLSEQISSPGLWVPTTSLKEGVRGQWTLLAVDPESTVRTLAVHVLHTESDMVFVQGAFPEGTRLIDMGPHRVTVGQKVTVIDKP